MFGSTLPHTTPSHQALNSGQSKMELAIKLLNDRLKYIEQMRKKEMILFREKCSKNKNEQTS
jgi:hypothetical protein